MEGDMVSMQEIFRFRRRGVSEDGMVQGSFEATGVRPQFAEAITTRGIALPADLFVIR
jgi:pilus assembly protein CpaF